MSTQWWWRRLNFSERLLFGGLFLGMPLTLLFAILRLDPLAGITGLWFLGSLLWLFVVIPAAEFVGWLVAYRKSRSNGEPPPRLPW